MKSKVLAAIAGVVVLALGGFLLVRWLESDETRIRRIVRNMADSVESESVFGFVADVADDYRDCAGLGVPELKQIALGMFREFEEIQVEISEPKVRIDEGGERAVAYFTFRMLTRASAGAPMTEFYIDQFGNKLIVLQFGKRDGRWKITGAEYGPGAEVPPEADDQKSTG